MKRSITIGEKYGPAMEIKDQASADRYFEELVKHSMQFFGTKREEAEKVERHNLGYFAGYFDNETRERVERLFKCAHPILGPIAKTGPLTADQAFNAGKAWAKKRS